MKSILQDNKTSKYNTYYKRESLRDGIISYILPKLRGHQDIKEIKLDLLEQAKNIYTPMTNSRNDLEKIKKELGSLSFRVDKNNLNQVSLYNSLVDEADVCFDLPTNLVSGWTDRITISNNKNYICEFAELVECIGQAFDDLF